MCLFVSEVRLRTGIYIPGLDICILSENTWTRYEHIIGICIYSVRIPGLDMGIFYNNSWPSICVYYFEKTWTQYGHIQ
jgi:hypothetical protein